MATDQSPRQMGHTGLPPRGQGAGEGLDASRMDKRVEIFVDSRVKMLIQSQIDGRVVRLSDGVKPV